MGLVAPSQSNAGDLITAAAINSPVNQLAAVINGGLDSANLADGAVTVNKLSASIGSALTGSYVPLSVTPNTVTYNGNRSYTCVFNATDQSLVLSAGMRIRTQRTVASPVQSSSLNGTSQFWSKTAPAGMTFTDNFTVSAWVKLTSYSTGVIVSRLISGQGWQIFCSSSGQLTFFGATATLNRVATSYQSLPLNKWVHVAGSGAFSSGTLKVYIDGVEVPAAITGTATSIVQPAASLMVGANDGGTNLFPGKIAQAAVFSAVLTEATIKSYYSQGLTGTEPNLVSGYSFNGVATDLQTTNANNLTANASAGFTADSPFGGQANGTNSSTLDYGIVQKDDFATNTTVVIQVAEGCTIPTTGGVTSVAYSSQKSPFGFPGARGKWQLTTLLRVAGSQASPAVGTWYNLGNLQLALPIGEWDARYFEEITVTAGAGQNLSVITTLSTANNSESDSTFSATLQTQSTLTNNTATLGMAGQLSATVQTAYFINAKTLNGGVSVLTASNTANNSKIIMDNSYL